MNSCLVATQNWVQSTALSNTTLNGNNILTYAKGPSTNYTAHFLVVDRHYGWVHEALLTSSQTCHGTNMCAAKDYYCFLFFFFVIILIIYIYYIRIFFTPTYLVEF